MTVTPEVANIFEPVWFEKILAEGLVAHKRGVPRAPFRVFQLEPPGDANRRWLDDVNTTKSFEF